MFNMCDHVNIMLKNGTGTCFVGICCKMYFLSEPTSFLPVGKEYSSGQAGKEKPGPPKVERREDKGGENEKEVGTAHFYKYII